MTTYATPVGSRRPLRIGLIAPPWIPVPPPAYGGTEAVTRVLIESHDGSGARWWTVGVSDNIIDASFQALMDSIIYKLMKNREMAGLIAAE